MCTESGGQIDNIMCVYKVTYIHTTEHIIERQNQ